MQRIRRELEARIAIIYSKGLRDNKYASSNSSAEHSSLNSEIISVIYFVRDISRALDIATPASHYRWLCSHLLVQFGELIIKQPCAETTESQIRREPGLARQ